jgi:uncharacterized MAPEG superfamily protein
MFVVSDFPRFERMTRVLAPAYCIALEMIAPSANRVFTNSRTVFPGGYALVLIDHSTGKFGRVGAGEAVSYRS